MPQYLVSVWHDDDYSDIDYSSADMQRIGAQVNALNEEIQRVGAWVFGAGLRPTSSATVGAGSRSGPWTGAPIWCSWWPHVCQDRASAKSNSNRSIRSAGAATSLRREKNDARVSSASWRSSRARSRSRPAFARS